MNKNFPVRGWIGCWALFLGKLGSGSAFSVMTCLPAHELCVSVPSSSCSLQNWMSASAHPELCLGTEIKCLEDQRGWAFVVLIRIYPTAGSFPGHWVRKGWVDLVDQCLAIPWKYQAGGLWVNPSVIIIGQIPQQWVFSLYCAMAWSRSGKDPGS